MLFPLICDHIHPILWISWLPMFWTLHLIGCLSLYRLVVFFLELWSVLFRPYFFASAHQLCCKGWSLRYSPGRDNPSLCVLTLYVGEGSEREQWRLLCSLVDFNHSLHYHNQIGPFWCCFPGRWACACSRTLWVSPTDSPVRLGVSPAAAPAPTSVFSQRFWGFVSPHWSPGLRGLTRSPVNPPCLSARECGTPALPATTLPQVLSPQLPISAPPTSLDECFFFSSLVVRLPCSSIFC